MRPPTGARGDPQGGRGGPSERPRRTTSVRFCFNIYSPMYSKCAAHPLVASSPYGQIDRQTDVEPAIAWNVVQFAKKQRTKWLSISVVTRCPSDGFRQKTRQKGFACGETDPNPYRFSPAAKWTFFRLTARKNAHFVLAWGYKRCSTQTSCAVSRTRLRLEVKITEFESKMCATALHRTCHVLYRVPQSPTTYTWRDRLEFFNTEKCRKSFCWPTEKCRKKYQVNVFLLGYRKIPEWFSSFGI